MVRPVHYEVYNRDNPMHLECAGILSSWQATHNASMLPLNADVLAGHPLGVLAFDADGSGNAETLRAYNSVRSVLANSGTIEIGGLITDPGHPGEGWGWSVKPELYRHIRQRWFGWNMIIFANDHSLPMNKAMGFKEIERVPKWMLEDCGDCNKKKCDLIPLGKICCDTHIVMSASIENLAAATAVALDKMTTYGLVPEDH